MSDTNEWILCSQPDIGDVIRWNEPLWAKPNKPRGKRDKIGEQQVVAKLTAITETLEMAVLSVTKISGGDDAVLNITIGDTIRRKITTIELGNCHKQIG